MFDSFRRRLAAIVIVGCAVPTSAAERIYEIGLEAKPGGLQRTFSGWYERAPDQPNDPLDDAELADLAKLYAERLTTGDEIRQRFRGVFGKRMPQDVGGYGTYQMLATPLGTAHWYSERFGTAPDADGEAADRREAVDLIVDITAGWFEEEMKGSPHLPAVRRFVNQDLREDLRKLAATFWLVQAAEQIPAAGEAAELNDDDLGNRVLHYCQEHGYFLPEELPELRLMISGETDDDVPEFMTTLRRMLARKCGIPAAEADTALAFLSDETSLQSSWLTYLQHAPKFAPALAKWRAANGRVDQDGTDVFEAFYALMIEAGGSGFEFAFGDSGASEVRLTLRVAAAPYETNGTYDEVDGIVGWRRTVERKQVGVSPFCFAHWSEPDTAFQRAHFGKTLLSDDDLAHFAALFARLSPAHRAELATFWAAQTPGEKLQDNLSGFKFAGPADAKAEAVAGKLNEMLMDEL